MGLPIRTGPVEDVISWTVDQIVVSVGPYIFQTDEVLGASCSTRSRGTASPPQRILRSLQPFHPASRSKRHVAGVACMHVAPQVSNISRNRSPSAAISRLARMTRAPTVSGKYSSSPAMSNDIVVTANKASLELIPGRA